MILRGFYVQLKVKRIIDDNLLTNSFVDEAVLSCWTINEVNNCPFWSLNGGGDKFLHFHLNRKSESFTRKITLKLLNFPSLMFCY